MESEGDLVVGELIDEDRVADVIVGTAIGEVVTQSAELKILKFPQQGSRFCEGNFVASWTNDRGGGFALREPGDPEAEIEVGGFETGSPWSAHGRVNALEHGGADGEGATADGRGDFSGSSIEKRVAEAGCRDAFEFGLALAEITDEHGFRVRLGIEPTRETR